MAGLGKVSNFPVPRITDFFSGKKTQGASSAHPSDPAKGPKEKGKSESAAEPSPQRPSEHRPGEQSPASLQVHGRTAQDRKTRRNRSEETPAPPPSGKTAKAPTKSGGRLERFFHKLFGRDRKGASEGTAAPTPPKAEGAGTRRPAPTVPDRNPPPTPRPGESMESFIARIPPEQIGWAHKFPSPHPHDKARSPIPGDAGAARTPPRKTGGTGPMPPPAGPGRNTRPSPRFEGSMESFIARIPPNELDWAREFPIDRRRGNAGTVAPEGRSAGAPKGDDKRLKDLFKRFDALKPPKQDLDSLLRRFEALKQMGPPGTRPPPPGNQKP